MESEPETVAAGSDVIGLRISSLAVAHLITVVLRNRTGAQSFGACNFW